jgi:CRISPR-associated exonuclease Cas4
MLALAAILALLAFLLFWLSARQQRRAGLPGGRVIYADTGRWNRAEKPLYAPSLNLTGKPDYLVEQNGRIIPVEVKSSRVGEAPYDAHIFQLAAYCYLVEHSFGKRPPYGILHYPNRTFAIDYTRQLQAALEEILAEMRTLDNSLEVERSHSELARCRRCGYRNGCDQALR